MTGTTHFVDEKSFEPLTREGAIRRLEQTSNSVFVVSFSDDNTQAMMAKVITLFCKRAAERAAELSESRIEALLETFLALDPIAPVEARIDLQNAEKRKEFLDEFPVIDAIKVHELSGHTGSNPSQTATTWRKANKILGLPAEGRTLYPLFQFDDAGRPYPLLKKVLEALPKDMTPWQRAFWLVSPSAHLNGQLPLEMIRGGDSRAVSAASRECEEVIG